jgi:hypothetical protein
MFDCVVLMSYTTLNFYFYLKKLEVILNIEILKDEKKLNNISNFIKATRSIIDKEGITKVSTRKISALSGLHNSTIYSYFDNLSELVMLSCISYFNEYCKALKAFDDKQKNPEKKFIGIWDIFMQCAFKQPEIFYYFFFEVKEFNLETLFKVYYMIFPEEANEFTDTVAQMYYGPNIYARSIKILGFLINNEHLLVNKDNITLVNELIVEYSGFKIIQAKLHTKSKELLKQEFIQILYHITGLKNIKY